MRYWIFAINIWNASGDDKDFSGLDLGDIRRNERFVAIINSISTSPGSSIPQQNCDWYDTKATYEFYKNDDISIDALRSAISSYGRQLIKEEQVMIAHDFCQISYNDSALWDAVSELEPAAKTSISIPDNGWTKRVDIDVEVRFHQVEILRPDTSKNEYRSIKMTAVERRQVSPKMEWQKEQLH